MNAHFEPLELTPLTPTYTCFFSLNVGLGNGIFEDKLIIVIIFQVHC